MEFQKAEMVTQYERNDVKEQSGRSSIVVMLNSRNLHYPGVSACAIIPRSEADMYFRAFKLPSLLQLFPTRSRDRQDNNQPNEFSSEAEGRYPAGDRTSSSKDGETLSVTSFPSRSPALSLQQHKPCPSTHSA